MSSRPSLVRIHRIHEQLRQQKPCGVRELAALLECSERTVRRDIEYLRDFFGAPIAYSRSQGGYRYSAPYELAAPRLTADELEAVGVACRLLQATAGTPYHASLERVLRKFGAVLGITPGEMDAWRIMLVPGEQLARAADDQMEAVFRLLRQAIQQQRVVCIEYHSPKDDATTIREIEPLRFNLSRSDAYCLAYCRLRQDTRQFRIDRVLHCRLTDECFEWRPGIDPDSYFEDSLELMHGEPMELLLQVSVEQARYLDERRRHASQEQISRDATGVTYRYRIADTLETLRWVLSLGSEAQVLGPEAFVAKVVANLNETLQKYTNCSQADNA